jgi:H+-transporting ATPase
MVTGDQLAIAVETSKRLGLGTNIMEGKALMAGATLNDELATQVNQVDGFAGVYPEHKHRIVDALQGKGRLVGMTGDGVNDAPALKKANVGIAVAGATAAAKGAADIILTEEGISTIITAISRSRMIFRRLETYIIYRIASSLLILGFFFFAIVILEFEIPTWVLVVISITNDVSAMFTSFDKVHTSPMPELWNMTKCICMASALAVVGIAASVLMLVLASVDRANWWHIFNFTLTIPAEDRANVPGKVVAVMYLTLTALIQLNLIATRNPSFWWRFSKKTAPRPSLLLLLPVACFLLGATLIAVYWPLNVRPDGGRGAMDGAGWAAIGIAWAYVIIWWFLADLAKTIVSKVFRAADETTEHCKRDMAPVPRWVAVLNAPAAFLDRCSESLGKAADAAWAPIARCFGLRQRRTDMSRAELRSEMSNALSLSRASGISVDELRASASSGIGRRGRSASASRGTLPPGLGNRMVKINMPEGPGDTAFETKSTKK